MGALDTGCILGDYLLLNGAQSAVMSSKKNAECGIYYPPAYTRFN